MREGEPANKFFIIIEGNFEQSKAMLESRVKRLEHDLLKRDTTTT